MKQIFIWSIVLISIGCTCGVSQPIAGNNTFVDSLSAATVALTKQRVIYDPGYYKLDYPGGDVPANRGVCTDVVIRAYRAMGIDLQREVYEDMRADFSKYPNSWGLKSTDKNIDHRRVPNLMVFFERKGTKLAITDRAEDYLPGDIVCWRLDNGMTHIGLIVDRKNRAGTRYMVVHNIGYGQRMNDCLFDFKIIGHYRYSGK